MGIWCFLLVFALATLAPVSAHIGERIFPFYEIVDENLIDVTDGRIDEWEDLFEEPSLTALVSLFIPNPAASDLESDAPAVQYDPSNLDFRIWLGWNDASEHIYIAAQFVDDRFLRRQRRLPGRIPLSGSHRSLCRRRSRRFAAK